MRVRSIDAVTRHVVRGMRYQCARHSGVLDASGCSSVVGCPEEQGLVFACSRGNVREVSNFYYNPNYTPN